jgi:hypothetical protein
MQNVSADNVSALVDEYQTILSNHLNTFSPNDDKKCQAIKQLLQKEADWTPNGAEAIVDLATNYGSFVLRNALALSIALNIEDGRLGL